MIDLDPATITIRSAQSSDLASLGQLRYTFRSELGQPNETESAFLARMEPWLSTHLAHPLWRIWVAVTPSDVISGHIFLQLIEKVPNPVAEAEHIAYITNAYVLPEYRNRGLGRRLLETAIAACPAETVDTIILWPSSQSKPLYARAGFHPPERILERALGWPSHEP